MSVKRRRNMRPAALLMSAAAALLLVPGCTARKQAEVRQVVDGAGEQEPGTTVHWVRGAGTKKEKEIIHRRDGRWASSARASSSFDTVSEKPGWGPNEATGPPDVPGLGLDGRGWGPEKENAGYEWLELTYPEPVHATGVAIREVHAPGCVVMVQLRDSSGEYHLKWKGTDRFSKYVSWLVLEFPATDYLTRTVRVTLDTTRAAHWKEIDAVQLRGFPD